MLEFFRSHLGGIFGLTIVGVLAFAFAFSFGSQSRGWGEGQAEQFAATVNGKDIPETTVTYAFNLLGGRSIGQDDAEWSRLRRSTLDGLIERELLLGLAKETGISASTDEAEERVVNNEFFLTRPLHELAGQIENNMFLDSSILSRVLVKDGHRARHSFVDDNGQFDLETYQKFVRFRLQSTEESFIEQQRLEIVAERMRQLMVNSIRISPSEVRAAYDREHDTATIEYIRLIPSYFADQLDPSAEELEAWTNDHKDDVAQYYETNKFRYTNLEKMAKAQHILIKVEEEAEAEVKTKARADIEGLLKRARADEDFAALAKEFSEDPGSAVKGGDLGFTPRGRMVPEFDDAMFKATPGQITDVIETKYGFHIIKVNEFREGNISLEQATSEIAELLFRRAQGETVASAKGEAFLARLKSGEAMAGLVPKEEGKTPDPLGMKVLSSRPFAKSVASIPGITGKTDEMIKAAFELTEDNPVPKKVFKVQSDYYVMRLKERNVPNDEEFGKTKEKVAESLLALKQGAWIRDRMEELKRQAEQQGRVTIRYTPGTIPVQGQADAPQKDDQTKDPKTEKSTPEKKASTDKPDQAKKPESTSPDDESKE